MFLWNFLLKPWGKVKRAPGGMGSSFGESSTVVSAIAPSKLETRSETAHASAASVTALSKSFCLSPNLCTVIGPAQYLLSTRVNTGEGTATHSSVLAWRTPRTEEPAGLLSMGVPQSQTWLKQLSMHACMHWRRKWQPTPVFLPGEPRGQRNLLGCCPWGYRRVRHDWSNLAHMHALEKEMATHSSVLA